jgi:hypothetical protein
MTSHIFVAILAAWFVIEGLKEIERWANKKTDWNAHWKMRQERKIRKQRKQSRKEERKRNRQLERELMRSQRGN